MERRSVDGNNRARRPGAGRALLLLAVAGTLGLAACAGPWDAPSARPRTVIWRYVAESEVGRLCGDPALDGCALRNPKAMGDVCMIITRTPRQGDYALVDVLAHEAAHCDGWTHPAWPRTPPAELARAH
jgi:hypothetical protein